MLIIDGHNLIPRVEGISLDELDDEQRLVELLQEYARLSRKQVLVFFDNAPPGFAGERVYGMVRARFVPAGGTADNAIAQHLRGMKKGARKQVRVVSSDHQVQAEARSQGAAVIDSDAFAHELSSTRAASAGRLRQRVEPPAAMDETSLKKWYELFGLDEQQAEKPIEPQKPQPPKTPRPRRHHGFPKKRA